MLLQVMTFDFFFRGSEQLRLTGKKFGGVKNLYWRSFWGGERQITNEGVRKEKIKEREKKKQIKKHSKNNIDNTASGEENEYN